MDVGAVGSVTNHLKRVSMRDIATAVLAVTVALLVGFYLMRVAEAGRETLAYPYGYRTAATATARPTVNPYVSGYPIWFNRARP
jgi:hypothetical protein